MPKEPITRLDLPAAPKWAIELMTEVRALTHAVEDMSEVVAEVKGQLDTLDVLRRRVRVLEVKAAAAE